MRLIIAALLVVLSFSASAQQRSTAITFTTISQHFASDGLPCNGIPEFNETNPGVGFEWWKNEEVGYAAGVYKNSIDRTSFYGAGRWMPLEYRPFRFGLIYGVATGYCTPLLPFAGFVITTNITNRLSIDVMGNPPVGSDISGVITALVRYRF